MLPEKSPQNSQNNCFFEIGSSYELSPMQYSTHAKIDKTKRHIMCLKRGKSTCPVDVNIQQRGVDLISM